MPLTVARDGVPAPVVSSWLPAAAAAWNGSAPPAQT
jgi:hypothetical protein